ncbi:MAG: class I SAM-dependent methyltransferase [Gemmatimonadaceae bacterium]|nr:class I SAM-dependent methyltransferase [Gemmatimonadaceae bacterium]
MLQDADAPLATEPIPGTTACKCCGEASVAMGTVDFNRTCEDSKGRVFGDANRPVPYHRCIRCGFIFTAAFDHFAPGDWQRDIYNDDYVLADPDFVERRPIRNGEMVANTFAQTPGIAVLDYGGGNGRLVRQLAQRGFARATCYDPFHEGSTRPSGTFDLVTSFEVLEHSPTPYETLRDMRWFLSERGLLLFSTLLQPADIDAQGLSWWYASPRNGHVSLYSRAAMDALMKRLGLQWASCSDVLHVAYRKRPPAFARHIFSN